MMMGAQEAGFDPTDQRQIDRYVRQLNAARLPDLAPQRKTPTLSAPDPYAHIGRNDRVTVTYPDGSRKQDVKFKFVEKDLRAGKCEL